MARPGAATATTFADNLRQPVHRWFRYSAGYSATWARSVIADHARRRDAPARVLDPFAGSGTTLVAADEARVPSLGLEAQPFVARVCRAKLQWDADADALVARAEAVAEAAASAVPERPPNDLVRRCFAPEVARDLARLQAALPPEDDLAWLALVAIVRRCSHAGVAPWQYVLPSRRREVAVRSVAEAFVAQCATMAADMRRMREAGARRGSGVLEQDAREPPPGRFTLVLTSPPYANNYDYADATRLELSALGELDGYGGLHAYREGLVPSCTQHVGALGASLDALLGDPALDPVRDEVERACRELAETRLTRGGRKSYDRMVAAYFGGMARHFAALARGALAPEAELLYVVGDSAPYGVHVPTEAWLGRLAEAQGLRALGFEPTRARNVKWRNRKHRVPLREGILRLRAPA